MEENSKQANTKPMITDKRFSHMYNSKKFRAISKKAKKVKIDARFKDMLTDDRFRLVSKKDRYGRDREMKPLDEFKDFYEVDDEEIESKDKSAEAADAAVAEEEEEEDLQLPLPREERPPDEGEEYSESDEDGSSEEESSSLIEEESEESESEEEEQIPRGDETSRLALVNVDWDRIKAVDILVACNSFLPPNGHIKSVVIYYSDFGLEMIEKEDKYGPNVWREKRSSSSRSKRSTESSDQDEEATLELDEKKLRKREFGKLKYFFAIIDTDSVASASAIYKNLDGQEVERTGNVLDLRFVPDDISFEGRKIKDQATEIPANYEPPKFESKVLGHSKLRLTWDETPPERTAVLQRKVSLKDLRDTDYKAYLADSESEEEDDNKDAGQTEEHINPQQRAKFSDLLQSISILNEPTPNAGAGMDVTFEADFGLEEKAAALLEAKKKKDAEKNQTLFEKQRQKLREKRAARKAAKESLEESGMDTNDEDMDETDQNAQKSGGASADSADPWENFEEGFQTKKQKRKNRRKKRKDRDNAEQGEKTKEQLELELMVEGDEQSDNESDEDPEKRLERQKKILADPRFSSLVTDPRFNPDPTHNYAKKMKDASLIIKARQEARARDTTQQQPQATSVSDLSTESLIAKIKRNASSMQPPPAKKQKLE